MFGFSIRISEDINLLISIEMKRSKLKSCKKSTSHSTFSMIKFYESIPSESFCLSHASSQINEIICPHSRLRWNWSFAWFWFHAACAFVEESPLWFEQIGIAENQFGETTQISLQKEKVCQSEKCIAKNVQRNTKHLRGWVLHSLEQSNPIWTIFLITESQKSNDHWIRGKNFIIGQPKFIQWWCKTILLNSREDIGWHREIRPSFRRFSTAI